MTADTPVGRFAPRDPTIRRRPRDRSPRLGAERSQAHSARKRCRRATAGTTGRSPRQPRIARRRWIEGRILSRDRLANQDGSRLAQPAHDRGILASDTLLPQPRAGSSRPVEDVEDVLDPDWNTVQGAPVVALVQFPRQPLGLGPRSLAVD